MAFVRDPCCSHLHMELEHQVPGTAAAVALTRMLKSGITPGSYAAPACYIPSHDPPRCHCKTAARTPQSGFTQPGRFGYHLRFYQSRLKTLKQVLKSGVSYRHHCFHRQPYLLGSANGASYTPRKGHLTSSRTSSTQSPTVSCAAEVASTTTRHARARREQLPAFPGGVGSRRWRRMPPGTSASPAPQDAAGPDASVRRLESCCAG